MALVPNTLISFYQIVLNLLLMKLIFQLFTTMGLVALKWRVGLMLACNTMPVMRTGLALRMAVEHSLTSGLSSLRFLPLIGGNRCRFWRAMCSNTKSSTAGTRSTFRWARRSSCQKMAALVLSIRPLLLLRWRLNSTLRNEPCPSLWVHQLAHQSRHLLR